jgi:hypothetical protein
MQHSCRIDGFVLTDATIGSVSVGKTRKQSDVADGLVAVTVTIEMI